MRSERPPSEPRVDGTEAGGHHRSCSPLLPPSLLSSSFPFPFPLNLHLNLHLHSHTHSRQHANDGLEELVVVAMRLLGKAIFNDRDIEAGGDLECRPPCDCIEPAFVPFARSASAFSNIERNRARSPDDLVSKVGMAPGKSSGQSANLGVTLHRLLVDRETFEAQHDETPSLLPICSVIPLRSLGGRVAGSCGRSGQVRVQDQGRVQVQVQAQVQEEGEGEEEGEGQGREGRGNRMNNHANLSPWRRMATQPIPGEPGSHKVR